MKFIVRRTSEWDHSVCPHEKTYKSEYTMTDIRTCSEEELDSRFPFKWRDSGYNHRILENGYIARDFCEECWCADVDNLEDLISFIKDVGAEVVIQNNESESLPIIEIYDDYRE